MAAAPCPPRRLAADTALFVAALLTAPTSVAGVGLLARAGSAPPPLRGETQPLVPLVAPVPRAFNPFFIDLADSCQCTFHSACNCDAELQFMTCLADACNSGRCQCKAANFKYACDVLSMTCPSDGLQCSAKQASCMGSGVGEEKAVWFRPDVAAVTPTLATPKPVTGISPDVKEKTPSSTEKHWSLRVPGDVIIDSQMVQTQRWHYLIMMSIDILIMLVFAYLYDRYRRKDGFKQLPRPPNKDHFRYGFCSCLEDKQISFLACCCPALRWADTMDKTPVTVDNRNWKSEGMFINSSGRYWMALGIFLILQFLMPLTFCLWFFVFIGVMTFSRQQLRKRYNIKNGGTTVITDCLAWLCCTCCAIVQEARQVEFDYMDMPRNRVPAQFGSERSISTAPVRYASAPVTYAPPTTTSSHLPSTKGSERSTSTPPGEQ